MLENSIFDDTEFLEGEILEQVIDLNKKEQEKVVEARREDVEVLPDSDMQVLSKVTVKGVTAGIDENIKPENIKLGVNILGIEGNVAPDKPDQEKTIYPSEEEQVVVADNGFELAKVIAKPVETESFEIIPSTSEQVVKASEGKFIKEVVVEAIEDIESEIAEQEEKLEILEGKVDDLPIYEPIVDDLTAQSEMVDDIMSQVDSLKDISNETLNIDKNGEYDVIDYGKVVVDAKEDLDAELDEQESELVELRNQANELKDVSEETLVVRENGEYDIVDYGKLIVNVGDNVIKMDLPEEFATASNIYYFILDNDTILFSSNASNSDIWRYKINTNNLKKGNIGGYGYNVFRQVSDTKCLIGRNSSTGYGHGVLLYNLENDEFVDIYTSDANYQYFQQVSETKWLISPNNGNYGGILLYNSTDDTIIRAYNNGNSWQIFQQVSDTKWLIGSSASAQLCLGVLLYNSDTDSFTLIHTTGYSWAFYQVSKSKWLITSMQSSVSGLWLYNSLDDSIVQLLETAYNWRFNVKINDDKFLLSNSNSTSKSILLYKPSDDSIVQISADFYYLQFSQQVTENKWLISCGSAGLFLYNSLDDSFIRIYTTDTKWQYYQQVTETRWLIGSGSPSSNVGLLRYDSSDDSAIKIYSSGYNWGYFCAISGKCLVTSTSYNGVLLYNSNSDTITRPYQNGTFNMLTLDGDVCYIENTNKNNNKFVVKYNSVDDSIKAICYYLEVE